MARNQPGIKGTHVTTGIVDEIKGDTYERVLTNAIGYEIWKHDHEVTTRDDGVNMIVISDEETERARAAAKRVVEELRGLGALNP